MKKLLFLFALSLTSCAGLLKVNAQLGMSEEEFKARNVGEVLVYAEEGVTAYGMYADIWETQYLYYYFTDGKLVEINQGVRQPNVIIQNN
jgi:hypothetical protein